MTADPRRAGPGYVVVRRRDDGTYVYLRARMSHPAALFSARRIAAHEVRTTSRPWYWSPSLPTRFETAELAAATNPEPDAWVEPADHVDPI